MGDQNDGRECQCSNTFPARSPPEDRDPEKGQSKGNVVIEKAGMKCPPIRQHGNTRQKGPRDALAGGAEQRERAPEEDQHGQRNRYLLARWQAEHRTQSTEQGIKENILHLWGDRQPRRLAMLDAMDEPRIVHVAAEIAGLDVTMP